MCRRSTIKIRSFGEPTVALESSRPMLTPGRTTVGGHVGCVKPHASIEACRSCAGENSAQHFSRHSEHRLTRQRDPYDGGQASQHRTVERSRDNCACCADRESGWLTRQPANKFLPNHYEGYASHPSATTGQTRACTAANRFVTKAVAVLAPGLIRGNFANLRMRDSVRHMNGPGLKGGFRSAMSRHPGPQLTRHHEPRVNDRCTLESDG